MSYITADISLKLSHLFHELMLTQMQDFSRAVHTFHYALQAHKVEGDIIEFGTFQGHTARILSCMFPDKKIYVYDSFEGSPPSDEFKIAGLCKTTIESFKETFENEHIPLPIIHQGWFSDLTEDDIPEKICFAHLDANLYISTIDPLRLIYNRVSKNGIILIDDCPWFETPGVHKACQDFFADKLEQPLILEDLPGYKNAPKKTVIIKQ